MVLKWFSFIDVDGDAVVWCRDFILRQDGGRYVCWAG